MRIKLDENLPSELAADARAAGHDADTVLDEDLGGADDEIVVAAAKAERRVLFTLDKGIANQIRFPRPATAGLVLFRLGSEGRGAVVEFVRSHLRQLLQMDTEDRVTVVSPTRIRIS